MTRLVLLALLLSSPALADTRSWRARPLPHAGTYARQVSAGEGATPIARIPIDVEVWSDVADRIGSADGQDATYYLVLPGAKGAYSLELFRRVIGVGIMDNKITALRWERPSILRVEYVDGMLEGAMDGEPAKDHYRDVVVFCGVGASGVPSCTEPLVLRDDDAKHPRRKATVSVDAKGVATVKKHPTRSGTWKLVFE